MRISLVILLSLGCSQATTIDDCVAPDLLFFEEVLPSCYVGEAACIFVGARTNEEVNEICLESEGDSLTTERVEGCWVCD